MPRGVNKDEGISYWVAGSYREAQGKREIKFHGGGAVATYKDSCC